jgi:hypothetical protein
MNCISLAIKAADGRLLASEIDDAILETDKIKGALIAAGKTDNLDQRALAIAMNRAMEKKIEAARLKRQVAQNIKARAAADLQIKEHLAAGRTPLQALRALYEGSQRAVKGARSSAAAQGAAYEAKWIGSLFAGIQKDKPHLLRMLGDRNLDTAVTKELWELREGGLPGSTGNADAKWLARELSAHMEMARVELNRLGAAIGQLDGYAGPQVHDDIAMLKAGRETWVNQILPRLDLGRSFPEATSEAEVRGILSGVYDTIITGVSKSDSNPLLNGQRVGPSNLAKSMGKHRVLHFRDAQSALEYRDTFGRGSTIQGILGQLRHSAHNAGVLDRFGPNPRAMMNALAMRLQQDLRDQVSRATDLKTIARLNKQIEQLAATNGEVTRLQATLDQATGVASRPVSITSATIGSNIRAWQQMSKLGGAVLTAIPSDTMTAATAAMMRGQGFWKGLFGTIGEMMNRPNGKEIAFLLGEGFDGIVGHVSSAAVPFDLAPGAISKLTVNFFRWSGLSGWTDTVRAASARVIAAHLGFNTGKTFDALDPSLRHVLNLNGIDAPRWEAIRKAAYREVNGHNYITPDAVRHLDDALIEPIVSARIEDARAALLKPTKKGNVTDTMRAKFEEKRSQILDDGRRELELDLHRYYADETSYAVIEADAATQRMVTRGYRPGTLAGETIRYIMQFKAFPVAFSTRVLGRMALNAPAGRGTQVAHIGTMLAGLTVAGYAAILMKDAARGIWPPRDPFSPATWAAAALQGGALGIYGDFLFGQKSRFDQGPIETLSGPMIGNLGDLWTLYQSARDGDPNAGKALDLMLSNTPFINLFYTRPAMDFLFINSLREAVRPGYLARQSTRLKKERGQEFVLPRTVGEALAH